MWKAGITKPEYFSTAGFLLDTEVADCHCQESGLYATCDILSFEQQEWKDN